MQNKFNVHIRVELASPLSDQFKAIKNHLLLTNNTEVIRTLIREAYHRLDDEKTPHLVDDGGRSKRW